MAILRGLIIAANSSGVGKTSASVALAIALRERGYRVAVAKLGPDFIDAGWLSWAAESPCANIDSRMTGKKGIFRLLRRLEISPEKNEILICESAMGLYDGDRRGKGTAAELATILKLPVLLLLDAKGMGGSIAPLAHGFLSYEPATSASRSKPRFCGIICSKVSGERHAELLAKSLRPVLRKYGVPLLGNLPKLGAPVLDSRHLGLLQASEVAPSLDRESLRIWAEKNCDIEKLLATLNIPAPPGTCREMVSRKDWRFVSSIKPTKDAPRVAIARDEAFEFCYADLPAILEENGCEPFFFSPLSDPFLPDCDGCYIPGGYPELYAAKLSRNISMLLSLRARAREGLPFYAECGGFVYLSRGALDPSGKRWPLAGIIPQECVMDRRLRSLGYRFVRGRGEMRDIAARGHEFHYCRGTLFPDSPLWEARDSEGKRLEPQGYKKDNILASWVHLYPEGSGQFWKFWTAKVRDFSEKRKRQYG
ncbi:MAG: cobyrinate a,c-diamide synthase [Desulfovibrio sp.]|nr:cobyrinate a,c-diamide synthase [Desulfovibrio sp.]